MEATEDKYFECPYCGFAISFHYDYSKGKYVSMCPFCQNRLEIVKEEFERDDVEIYFEPDQGII